MNLKIYEIKTARDDCKRQSQMECGSGRSTNLFCNLENEKLYREMITKLIDHGQEFTNI